MPDFASLEPNDAWILFRLNRAPVMTEVNGDFNVICLMDAASCYMLGTELAPATSAEVAEVVVERLVDAARAQASRLPETLIVPLEMPVTDLAEIAVRLGIEVALLPDEQLLRFTAEARDGFEEHVGTGRMQ